MTLNRTFLIPLACMVLATGAAAQQPDDRVDALASLAEAGDAEALYHLGMVYHTGFGVDRDTTKALTYFQQGAALGDPLAAYKLGCYYAGQEGDVIAQNPAKALQYKLVAAEAGYALAQQDVAALYAQSGNMDRALHWLEKAAAQGYSQALFTMASVHNGATGIAKDPAITAAYFRLFLDRAGGEQDQVEWLSQFEKGLSDDNRSRAAEIVEAYVAIPSPLTIKAMNGIGAADALIQNSQ